MTDDEIIDEAFAIDERLNKIEEALRDSECGGGIGKRGGGRVAIEQLQRTDD